MRSALTACVLLIAAAGLVLSSGGCGGGDGTPGPGTDAFVGTYHYFGLVGAETPATLLVAQWGTVTADGMGSFTLSSTDNNLGAIVGPGSDTFLYTIGADRSIGWRDAGPDFLRGGISANGRLVVLGDSADGRQPAMAVLLRREGTYSVASLNGDYHLAGWMHNVPSGENSSHFGFATFNGAGAGTYVGPGNIEGTLPAVGALAFSYTVAADGALQMDFTTWSWVGGVVAGGELVVVSGATDGGDFPVLQAFVKESTAASLATISGDYFVAGMEHDFTTPGFRSSGGKATADGLGGIQLTLTQNDEGTVTTNPTAAATYDVDIDGEVTLTTGGGEDYGGGVTPSGDVVILGGPNTPGAEPGFFFLIR